MSKPAELSVSNHEVITQPDHGRENDTRIEFTTNDGLTIRIRLRSARAGDPTVFFWDQNGVPQWLTIYPTESVEIEGAEVGFDAVAYAEHPGSLIVLDQVASAARYRRARIRPFEIKEMSLVA